MSQIIAEEVAAYLVLLLAPVITAGTNTIEQWFNANVYLPLQKFFTDSLFQFTGQLQTFVGNILTGGATGSPPSWIDIPSLIIYILNGNAPQFSGIYNTAIKALTDYFANNTNLITSITTVIGTSINSIFSTTGTAANAFFTQLSTSLLDAVSKIGPDILDTYASLTTVFNSLTTVITTDLTSIMGTSVDILQYMKFDLTNLISTSLATVVQAITLIPDNAFITITNDVLPLLTTVEKELSGFINVTGASLQFAAFQITNSLSELETFVVEEFKAKVGDEGEYIINTLEAFMGPLVGIGATLALTHSSTMQLVSGVEQSTIDRVDNCCIETQNGFVNMNQALQQGLGNIWAQFDIQ